MSHEPIKFNPIDIKLSSGRSVSINHSGGESEYRYDIYEDGIIIGAIGMDELVDNV